MPRRALPYTPFAPPKPPGSPLLPMDVPTLAFRNHYKDGLDTRRGELPNTVGDRAHVIPLQSPHDTTAGGPAHIAPYQGENGDDPTISSNTVTGGVVKGYITSNNSIRKAVIVSRNLYSPTSHPSDAARAAASAKIPPPAIKPSKDIGMPPKMGKRGSGGNFTYPAPMAAPVIPTSTDFLRSRFGR
jgi:hypothetical protein